MHRIWPLVAGVLAVALSLTLAGNPRAYAQVFDAQDEAQLTLGVQAAEGATRTLEAWTATARLLNSAARGQDLPYRFAVKPHTDASLISGMASGQINLMLGDPATFVVAQVEDGARALLSVANIWEGTTYDQTGALVFVRADSAVRRFSDIADRRIMAVAPQELTGWKLAKQEFRKHRLNVEDMSGQVMFSGGNQREVVYAVQNGLVEVGVVRAGVLEALAKEGAVSLDEFRPVMPISHGDYPFWVSTPLYPGWVLAAGADVKADALALVIDTLLRVEMESDSAKAAGGVVWQAPQNYQSVHELMISLRARPYQNHVRQAAARIYFSYKWHVIGLSTAIFFSVLFLVHEMRRQARLAEARKNVLQSEARSKQFYRDAIEDHTLFCMLSKDGQITHVNNHFVSVLDRTQGSLIQRPLSEILKETNQEMLEGQIMEAMRAGRTWQGALQLEKEGSDTAWFQCTFIPITGASRSLSEVAIVASDITKTHQGASETRFNNTLELIQDQVVVLRPGDLAISYANAAAEQTLVKDRMGGVWNGKRVQDFITDEDLQLLKMRCQAVQEGPQRRIVWEAQGRGDVTYEISLEYAQPEHDAPCLIAIYRDVSERKAIEKAKNEFIATVSHELRTPLTSIKGALGLAMSGAVGEMPEKMSGVVDMAATSCDRLVVLINDILDLEKIEAGKMDYQMQFFDLDELVNDAMQSNAFYGEKFGVTFDRLPQDSTADYTTYGDPTRLTQVMDNLMSNAAKFSNPGSKILVGLALMEDRLRVTIRDFGEGIPKKAQATIFDKFTQADSSDTRSKGGTGLGLSIVKMIVEHHQGRVTFVSEEGAGTEFFVDLPMARDEKVIKIDALRSERDVPKDFSDPTSDAETIMLNAHSDGIVQHLIELAKRTGYEIDFESNRVTTGQIVSGRGVVGNSSAMDWLSPDQRGFLAYLTDAGNISDRSVAVVEITQAQNPNVSQSDRAEELIDLIRAWLDVSRDLIPDGATPNMITVSSLPELADALDSKEMLAVPEAIQTFAMPEWPETDIILQFAHLKDAISIAIYPRANAALPEEWPFVLVVSKLEEAKNARGVVSKFSSGGEGRRRRRA